MELHETDSGFVHLPLSKVAGFLDSKTLIMVSGMGHSLQTWTFELEDEIDLTQQTFKTNCRHKEFNMRGWFEISQESSETSLSKWAFHFSKGSPLFDQYFSQTKDSAFYQIIPIEK